MGNILLIFINWFRGKSILTYFHGRKSFPSQALFAGATAIEQNSYLLLQCLNMMRRSMRRAETNKYFDKGMCFNIWTQLINILRWVQGMHKSKKLRVNKWLSLLSAFRITQFTAATGYKRQLRYNRAVNTFLLIILFIGYDYSWMLRQKHLQFKKGVQISWNLG